MKMKKILLSLGLIFMGAGAAMAQEQGAIRIGAGLVYGSKAGIDDDGKVSGKLGINVGGEYFFTDKISAAPSFTYFMPSTFDGDGWEEKFTRSTLNIDGRYYFGEGDINFYGMAGLGIAYSSYKWEEEGDSDSVSANKTGINLGGGLIYPINDQLGLNGQIKYNTAFEQIAIQAGVAYRLK